MSQPIKLTRGIYLRGRVYWLKFQRDGKRRYISLETGDAIEAIQRANELRDFKFPDQPTPIRQAIATYLEEKKRLNIYSKATARVHGAALEEFAARVESRSLDNVTSKLAADHYAALQSRAKETTAQIHIRALRAFFNWCVAQRHCRSNPFAELRLAKIDQPARLRYCTKAERDKLLAEAPTDDLRFILFCGFHAGMRKNEIVEARAGWLDLSGGAIHLQNTATFR